MFCVTNPELLLKIEEWVQGNLPVSYPEHPLVHYVPGDETFRVFDYYDASLTTIAKIAVEDIWGIGGRISHYEKVETRLITYSNPWWHGILWWF